MPSYTVAKPSWFSRTHELRENDHMLGELTMLKVLSCALAEATMPDRTVRFGYKGWNVRKLFIQDTLGKDIADVKGLSWWKQDAAVTIDGVTYTWKQKNWWGTRSGWFTSDGSEVLEMHVHWWSGIDIGSPADLKGTTLLLALFGIYLLKLQEMDASAAGV